MSKCFKKMNITIINCCKNSSSIDILVSLFYLVIKLPSIFYVTLDKLVSESYLPKEK